MGLLQKKPHYNEGMLGYRVGLQQSLLVVGLGNPGKKYDKTRHNLGFNAVDFFASKHNFPKWTDKKDLKCLISTSDISENRIFLCKPTTYMNLSGEAVSNIANFYKIPVNKILVVHDDIDIEFGQIRTRMGGGSAGHNGIKSVIEQLDEKFGRVRVGIANAHSSKQPSEDFVLTNFSKDERKKLGDVYEEIADILINYCGSGNLLEETRKIIL